MMTATRTSGHPRDVPKTPSAASSTAQFPITSLREHSQTDCMLLSPARYFHRSAKVRAFASNAATPTLPIVIAAGSVPWAACQSALPKIHSPKRAHRDAFQQRGAGTIVERESGDQQADAIIRSITEKIERVRLEGHRTRRETEQQFGDEHGRIDPQHHPEHRSVTRVVAGRFCVVAARSAHVGWLSKNHGKRYSGYRVKDDAMSIGELAKATNVKIVTIRYYEQVGLMPAPARTEGNYRAYNNEHVQPAAIHQATARTRLHPRRSTRPPSPLIRRNQPCDDVDRITNAHLVTVEEKIRDLKKLATELRALSKRCKGGGRIAECRIIEALTP